MRHTLLFLTAAILTVVSGACLLLADQTATPQKKATPSVAAPKAQASPAKPGPSKDERIIQNTAQTTINWDSSSTQGAKAEVLLLKKDQSNGKATMKYHIKVSGAPTNKFYTLKAWPITEPVPVTMLEGLAIAKDGTVGCHLIPPKAVPTG